MKVVVRRSGLRMWLMAMGGIPLLVIALDVLTSRRITDWLRELVFPPADTQIFEPRDVIFAWVMLAFSVFIVGWGLKELFFPTTVIEGRDEGLAVRLSGPFRPPSLISWDALSAVYADHANDDGAVVPLLILDLAGTEGLPPDPWGARWLGDRRLGVLAEDWTEPPERVAEAIGELAESAAEAPTPGTGGVREEE